MTSYRLLFLFTLISVIILALIESHGIAQETILPNAQNLKLSLSDELLTVIARNKTSFSATVNNTGAETVEFVNISIEGIPKEWIGVFPQTKDVSPEEAEKYLVVINVPRSADAGIYQLKVKASDSIESNTMILTLIIGRNLKEIADLLLKELERIKAESDKTLLIKKCLDITVIKTFHDDAELAYGNGMKEYENKNYEKAINWLKYVIPAEKKVVSKADITIKTELDTINASKILMLPFFKLEEQFKLSIIYLEEKNYEKICDPILKIRRFVMFSLIFWPGIIIFFIILFILLFVIYKRKRGETRTMLLLRVKERLKT